jgi:C4-dicarboxylate transporter DctM subunit
MDTIFPLLLVGVLFFALGTGIWVALSLILVGMVALSTRPIPMLDVVASNLWSSSRSWDLAALPMFIWMGEILFRSRLSSDMFSGLAPLMQRLPGRLLHVNIMGCAIFAAVSGSSAATTATIGRISLPELRSRGYDTRQSLGSLAGAGTLGLLIPPSIIFIVYGAAIEESVARLFLAGVFPGLVLTGLLMGWIILWSLLNPQRMPAAEPRVSWFEAFKALRKLLPVVVLIIGVIGVIYTGLASPTESAALGVAMSLLIAWRQRVLTWTAFKDGLLGATRVSCMIAVILAGAAVLTVAMGFTGIPRQLAAWISTLGLSATELLLVLTLFFIVLGCFLDGISLVLLASAVIMPMVIQAGFDPIWFGVYLVIVIEMSQITPPVGMNLFVIQGLTGQPLTRIAWAALPPFMLLLLMVILLAMFPGLATWLPDTMFSR